MQHSFITGLAIVLAAGLFQGSFMFPSKWMKGWAWENYWLIFATIAYLISPWLLALATVPQLAKCTQPPNPQRSPRSWCLDLPGDLGR